MPVPAAGALCYHASVHPAGRRYSHVVILLFQSPHGTALGIDALHCLGGGGHTHLGNSLHIIVVFIVLILHLLRPAVVHTEPEKFQYLGNHQSHNAAQDSHSQRQLGIIYQVAHQEYYQIYYYAGNHGNRPRIINGHASDQIYHHDGDGKCRNHHNHGPVAQYAVNDQPQFGCSLIRPHTADDGSVVRDVGQHIIYHCAAAHRYCCQRSGQQAYCHRNHIGDFQREQQYCKD